MRQLTLVLAGCGAAWGAALAPAGGGSSAVAGAGYRGASGAPFGPSLRPPAVPRRARALGEGAAGAVAVQRANETSLVGGDSVAALLRAWPAAPGPSAAALLGGRFPDAQYRNTTRPLFVAAPAGLVALSAADGPMAAALDLLVAQHPGALAAALTAGADRVVATLWARVDEQAWQRFSLAVPRALPALTDGSPAGEVGRGGDGPAFFAVLRRRLAAVVPDSRISLGSSLDTLSLVLGRRAVRLPVATVPAAAAPNGTLWVPGAAAAGGYVLPGSGAAAGGRAYRVLAVDAASGVWTLRDVAAGLPTVAPLTPPLGGPQVDVAASVLVGLGALWTGLG